MSCRLLRRRPPLDAALPLRGAQVPQFAAMVKEEAKLQGEAAFSLTMPFDERQVALRHCRPSPFPALFGHRCHPIRMQRRCSRKTSRTSVPSSA